MMNESITIKELYSLDRTIAASVLMDAYIHGRYCQR